MRTVGTGHVVTWDSASVSYDPDVEGDDNGKNLKFGWSCRNHTDVK